MRAVVAVAAGVVAGVITENPVTAFQVGAAVYGLTGFLDPNAKVLGHRLNDLKAPQANYGAVIPTLEGVCRTAGIYVYASEKREVAHTTSQGKGGPGVDSTTFTYEIDVLILLAAHEGKGILNVRSNGKLVASFDATADVETLQASQETDSWREIRFYDGNPAQLPDPTYEAAVGVGNAPAYRGRSSVFIEGLNLGNSGQLPVLTFEYVREGSSAIVPQDGLLCHFEEVDAGKVVCARGPNLDMSGGSLDDSSPTPKFGVYRGTGVFTAGVTGAVVHVEPSTSWRAEGWFWPTGDGDLFSLGGVLTSNPAFSLELFTAFGAAWKSDVACDQYVGGGQWGDFDDRPRTGQWNHLGIQYDSETRQVRVFCNGRTPNVEILGAVTTFLNHGEFQTVSIGGSAYVDEFQFRTIQQSELYAATYTVPTAPFTAPPAIVVITPILPTLDDVVSRICLGTGQLAAADIDVTALSADTVRSMALSQVSTARNALETLMAGYLFECAEGEKLRFVKRGGSSVATIPYADLGASDDGSAEPLPKRRLNDIEIPARISIKYANALNAYQDGLEAADRLTTDSTAESVIELPLGLTPVEAKRLADVYTLDTAVGSIQIGPVALPRKYAHLEPSDVIRLTGADGSLYRARIAKLTTGGGINSFELALDDASVIDSEAETDEDYAVSVIHVRTLAETVLKLLDIPILRDADAGPGFYAAFGATGSWPGAELDRSVDDVTFERVLTLTDRAVMGAALSELGDFTGGNIFDEINTVTVNVVEGQLTSTTRDALLESEVNAMLIGNEVVQFRSASLVSPGVYLLSGFMRGRRGTEWATSTHGSGERVVLLQTTGLRRVVDQLSEAGLTRYWKAVTFGKTRASVVSQAFADTEVGLKPFAPVDLRFDTGAQMLTWRRRSRLSSRFLATATPLGENSERYDVEVRDGADVLQSSATVDAPSYDASALSLIGGDYIIPPIWGMKTISGDIIAVRDDQPRSPGVKTLVKLDASGGVAQSSPNLGAALAQWCNDGDNIYAAYSTITQPAPNAYIASKVVKLTRSTLNTIDATNTASTAGDYQGIAHDGTNVWVSEYSSGNLRKLNPTTLVSVAAYAITGSPAALAYNAGKLWVLCTASDDLVKWDIATQTEDIRIPLGEHAWDVLIAGSLVYVSGTTKFLVFNLSGSLVATHLYMPDSTLPQRSLAVFGSYVVTHARVATGSKILLFTSSTGALASVISSPVTDLVYIAGSSGSDLYITGSPGAGHSIQTRKYTVATAGLAGYSITVWQVGSAGRGYPATLEL